MPLVKKAKVFRHTTVEMTETTEAYVSCTRGNKSTPVERPQKICRFFQERGLTDWVTT